MHLATIGNNKILRTPPPHISSSEERIPRLTRSTLPNSEQTISLPRIILTQSRRQITPITNMPLCNNHTHDTLPLFNCTHIRTTLSSLDLWTDPAGVMELLARWRDILAGGPKAGWSDSPHKQWSGELVVVPSCFKMLIDPFDGTIVFCVTLNDPQS